MVGTNRVRAAIGRLLRRSILDSSVSMAVARLAGLVAMRGVSVPLVERFAVENGREVARVGVTIVERTAVVVAGMVELRPHLVERVYAPASRAPAREAGTNGEFGGAHEVAPLLELNPLAFFSIDVARENKTAGRIACTGGTVGVEFTALIGSGDVH